MSTETTDGDAAALADGSVAALDVGGGDGGTEPALIVTVISREMLDMSPSPTTTQ